MYKKLLDKPNWDATTSILIQTLRKKYKDPFIISDTWVYARFFSLTEKDARSPLSTLNKDVTNRIIHYLKNTW